MKKIFTLVLMCLLFVSILVGCKQESTASLVAKDLDNNLNKLSTTVNKLDTIDNKYISNPDLYSSIGTPSTKSNKFFALTFKKLDTTNNETNELIKQLLVNRIKENLLNQNKINSDDCYTCKKYCDNNGDCYYQDCNGNSYFCDTQGNLKSCGSIPSSCSYAGTRDLSKCPNATSLSANTLEDLEVERLSLEQNIQNSSNHNFDIDPYPTNTTIDDNINETTDTTNVEYNETTKTNFEENTDKSNDTTTDDATTDNTTTDETIKSDDNTKTDDPRLRIFYFTRESFSPYNLRYQPRFVSEYSEDNINGQIEAYLFKVQKLYAMTEDSIEANTILADCKDTIIDCIKEIQKLNECILNGNCEPTVGQLEALQNYITDLKTTITRLKKCNGELTKEVNDINNSNSSSIVNSVDVLNSRYLKLLNRIDTRITYHKSAIATLDQIKYLLDDTVNGSVANEEQILDIVENSNMTEEDKNEIKDIITEIKNNDFENTNDAADIDKNQYDNATHPLINDNKYNDIDNNNTIFDNNQNNENVEKNDNFSENYEENENFISNNDTNNNIEYNNINNENIDNKSNTANNDTTNETPSVNSSNENLNNNYDTNEQPVDTEIQDEIIENNNYENTQNEEKNTSVNHSNIDTYNQDFSYKNIDTYKPNNDIDTNTDSALNDSINDKNLDNNNEVFNNNENIDNNLNTVSDSNNSYTNDNLNTSNDMSNNTSNNENLTNNFDTNMCVNNNSGIYQNSVITQNNLDTNNGYGGYYYTNDGQIKNNGMNNDNTIGNNGESIETNLNSNNNVNTYGYNTMLDIINQGTVNNGINTL